MTFVIFEITNYIIKLTQNSPFRVIVFFKENISNILLFVCLNFLLVGAWVFFLRSICVKEIVSIDWQICNTVFTFKSEFSSSFSCILRSRTPRTILFSIKVFSSFNWYLKASCFSAVKYCVILSFTSWSRWKNFWHSYLQACNYYF